MYRIIKLIWLDYSLGCHIVLHPAGGAVSPLFDFYLIPSLLPVHVILTDRCLWRYLNSNIYEHFLRHRIYDPALICLFPRPPYFCPITVMCSMSQIKPLMCHKSFLFLHAIIRATSSQVSRPGAVCLSVAHTRDLTASSGFISPFFCGGSKKREQQPELRPSYLTEQTRYSSATACSEWNSPQEL